MNRISRLATTVVVSGGLGLAGLGLATGSAEADPAWGPSYSDGNCPPGVGACTRWCPGDTPYSWSYMVKWDWNVCHDWYWNSEGVVDIASNTIYPWHGVPHQAPPPPPPPAGPPPPPPPPPPGICIPFIGPPPCGL
ncbi:hypothetical protein [Mycobacterium sp.]|uniref:hypothetical protein n=1 Tax=Mycobacterium sp. TaxID=1785 RepID=UPI002DA7C937|nr:hypothetical protein [Mycobacterium sp.]